MPETIQYMFRGFQNHIQTLPSCLSYLLQFWMSSAKPVAWVLKLHSDSPSASVISAEVWAEFRESLDTAARPDGVCGKVRWFGSWFTPVTFCLHRGSHHTQTLRCYEDVSPPVSCCPPLPYKSWLWNLTKKIKTQEDVRRSQATREPAPHSELVDSILNMQHSVTFEKWICFPRNIVHF